MQPDLAVPQPFRRRLFPRRASLLPLGATAAAAFVAVPIVYVVFRAIGADGDAWQRLLQDRLWRLLGNTLGLTITVTAGALFIGASLAWLTERTNLPGRRVIRVILAIPLAIPAYIGGMVHLALMRSKGGLVPLALEQIFGQPVPTPSPLGFWGAAFVLTLFTYPYVFLLSGAAFRRLPASLEEAARTLGRTPWQTFRQVTLPVLLPGLMAGALLVALDILAEYGTVALLRYETFSSAIYLQLSGRYDRSAASVLSGVLVLLAGLILWVEMRLQGRRRFTQMEAGWRPAKRTLLKKWRLPAMLYVVLVVGFSLAIPLGVLLTWSIEAFTKIEILETVFRTGSSGIADFIWNSLWTAGLAALLAVIISLPAAIYAVRRPGRTSRFLVRFCQLGYAIPGVVIALSLVLLVNRYLPFLYATPLVVVLAYILRHMPQAVRSSEAALKQLSPTFEDSARSLGRNSLQTFFQVVLPLIFPGLLAGGALVFLTSLKELPATLLLRPPGFDTLAVRVWMWAIDGFYIQAAPAALILVITAALPLAFLLRHDRYNYEDA